MATIIAKNELVRRAVRYLDERLAAKPQIAASQLLDEACMRFNLGPADAENLQRLFDELLAKHKN